MRGLLTVFLVVALVRVYGQPYLSLEEVDLKSAPALHSGVYTSFEGMWVLIGGRTNGLHDFRPPLAFPARNANNEIWVIDPINDQSWHKAIDQLPDSIRDPLASSNLQWQLRDSILYIVGGYGWNSRFDSFMTYPTLTSVNIRDLIDAVKKDLSLDGLFSQTVDRRMAVCGGHMKRIDDDFYLVFGHDFNGRYHRKESAGFFSQEYTNEVRVFEIEEKASGPMIENYRAERDTQEFHRRDYNLVPQVFGDETFGFTAFSGVFQYEKDLPYYSEVDIYPDSVSVGQSFEQKLSHYHSAVLPVWDSEQKEMHTYFFGGMAEYYYPENSTTLQHDTMVPFVKTISRVTRHSNGQLKEEALPISMPSYLGTNAQFMPVDAPVYWHDEIIDFSEVKGKTLVGYIYGGIESELDNINRIDVSMSWASKRVFAIYMSDQVISEIPQLRDDQLSIYPNPAANFVVLELKSGWEDVVMIELINVQGQLVQQLKNNPVHSQIQLDISGLDEGRYFVRVRTESETLIRSFEVK